MTVYHTSDTHFGHVNILKYMHKERPFETLEEMAEVLVANFNKVVSPEDTLIIHGDFAMGIIKNNVPIAERLNGRKILIPGNHDRCWLHFPKKKQVPEMREFYYQFFDDIWDPPLRMYDGEYSIVYSHFPWREYAHDDREHEHHPSVSDYREGSWLIHGHVHGDWKIRPQERMINVGVDVWDLTPVKQEELFDIIEENS